MPLQNRVTPEGEIIATPYRGLMLGNRGGCFHNADKTLKPRRWASKQWIACVLSFKGRRRQLMQPNRYTELFFLDEATALAAGHRPCFECRRAEARRFAALWAKAQTMAASPRAAEMDGALHEERVGPSRSKLAHVAPLAGLPDGVFVRYAHPGDPARAYLIDANVFLAWTPAGYEAVLPRPPLAHIEVLTPPSIVAVLSAGYRPMLHPSAAALTG
ncbi:MAG: hypothetical protein F9K29_00385 [Hyphomicrobiaceae bacterium]|nr:MAG: hypothetical protein F9K29_00385 [Hyphomicrobiaceae bacterium]